MLEEHKSLIKNSNFIYVWISQVLSQLTINVMNFLLLTLLYVKTGSAIATSFLWISYSLPALIIGPIAAASVDMIDRRKMLMITNLLQAGIIFGYAFIHETSLFVAYGVVFLYAILNQFYVPAEAAVIPSVVSNKELPFANSLFLLTQQVALIFGFAMAGILNRLIGFTNTVYVCSFFVFVAFVSVSFLPQLRVKDSLPKDLEGAVIKFFERILEGYRFIKDHKEILVPFGLLFGMQVGLAIGVINIPVIASEIFKIGLNFSGLVVVVPAGVGALLGALFLPRLLKYGIRKRVLIEYSLLTLSASVLFLSIFVADFDLTVRLFFGTIFLLISGASFIGVIIPSQTFLQQKTPGGFRGRVFGNFWFMVTIATIIPVIFSGAIVELFGAKVLLIGFAFSLAAAYFFARKFQIKRLISK